MRERLRFILIIMLVGVLALPVPAATARVTAFDAEGSGGAEDTGVPFCLTVTNRVDHPVPGANVTLKARGPLLGLVSAPRSASTDAAGEVRVHLPPAEYQVTVMDPFAWYAPDAFDVKLIPGADRCAEPLHRELMEVAPPGYVTGRVVSDSFTLDDGSLDALHDARVTFARGEGEALVELAAMREGYEAAAEDAGVQGWEDDVRYRYVDTTGADGEFLLACPPSPGTTGFALHADAPDHVTAILASGTLADACGGTGVGSVGDVAALRAPVNVTGTVFFERGDDTANVAGAQVTAVYDNGDDSSLITASEPYVLDAVTDADGGFTVTLPWLNASQEEAFTLTVTREGFETVDTKPEIAPGTEPVVDFEVPAPQMRAFAPFVREYVTQGEPDVFVSDVDVCFTFTATPGSPDCGTTDVTGGIGCVTLPVGEHSVSIEREDGAYFNRSFTTSFTESDGGDDCATSVDPFADDADAKLIPAGRAVIRGTLVDAVAAARADAGELVDPVGIPFHAVHPDEQEADACVTDVDGSFDCAFAVSGRTQANVTDVADTPLYKDVPLTDGLVEGTVNDLGAFTLQRVELDVVVNLTGTFEDTTDPAPAPDTSATVTLRHAEFGNRVCSFQSPQAIAWANFTCAASSATRWDMNPTFTNGVDTVTRDWAPRAFDVHVVQPEGGAVYGPQECPGLHVTPAETRFECTLSAFDGGRLVLGTIVDEHDGAPVAGIRVDAWNPVTEGALHADTCAVTEYVCSVNTDENGAFQLELPDTPDVTQYCVTVDGLSAYQDLGSDAAACGSTLALSLYRAPVDLRLTARDAHSWAPLAGVVVNATTAGPGFCEDAAAGFECGDESSASGLMTLKLPWGVPFTLASEAFEGEVSYVAGTLVTAGADVRVDVPPATLTRVTDESVWLAGEFTFEGESDTLSVNQDYLLAREPVELTGTVAFDGTAPDADAETRVTPFPRYYPQGRTPAQFCAPEETHSPGAVTFDACVVGGVAASGDDAFSVQVPRMSVSASWDANDGARPWTVVAARDGYYAAASAPTAGGDVGELALTSARGADATLRFSVRDLTDAPLDEEIVWVCIRHVEGALHRADASAEGGGAGPAAAERVEAAAERCQYGFDVTFDVAWTRMLKANDARAENAFTFIVDATGHVPVTGIVTLTDEGGEHEEIVRLTPTQPGFWECAGDGPTVCPASEGDASLQPVEASARWLDRDGNDLGPAPGAWVVQPPTLTDPALVESGASRVGLDAYAGHAVDGSWSVVFEPVDDDAPSTLDTFRVSVQFTSDGQPLTCTLYGASLGGGNAYPVAWAFTVSPDGCEAVAATVTDDGAVALAPDNVPRTRFFADAAALGEV